MTNDILNKLSLIDKDLDAYSLETVEIFRRDTVAAGFTLKAEMAEKRSNRAVAWASRGL